MESLQASFIRELKNKLAQRSTSTQNQELILQKNFKFFDLNSNGTVEMEEFAKALEKIGIFFQTQQELQSIFESYDLDHSGAIDYKEFSTMMFGKQQKSGSEDPSALVEKLRNKLASRGARGMIGLGKSFRIMDDNNSRSLCKREFLKAMKDYMLGFSDQEIQTLFAYFDADRSGEVDYDEFIRQLRGPMNASRKKIVMQAFNKIDKDKSGYIEIVDIKGIYNGKKHPDVISGKKPED